MSSQIAARWSILSDTNPQRARRFWHRPHRMVDRINKQLRSALMGQVRRTNTKPEIIVRRLLHGLGFRFRLYRKDLPGRPDIVLPKWRTVIFVHGCFWHRHAGCRLTTTPAANQAFWLAKFARNKQRDRQNRQALRQRGWRSLVVWECETRSPDRLKDRLLAELKACP